MVVTLAGSSPRPWGCFYGLRPGRTIENVVPTPVGVFPSLILSASDGGGRPHARGGVSDFVSLEKVLGASSPRPWGCFHR